MANLGRLHLATRMPYTATTELEKAARLDPRNVATLCDLGEAYQRTLNFRSAESAYRRALKVDPKERMNLAGFPDARESVQGFRDALRSMLRKRRPAIRTR